MKMQSLLFWLPAHPLGSIPHFDRSIQNLLPEFVADVARTVDPFGDGADRNTKPIGDVFDRNHIFCSPIVEYKNYKEKMYGLQAINNYFRKKSGSHLSKCTNTDKEKQ